MTYGLRLCVLYVLCLGSAVLNAAAVNCEPCHRAQAAVTPMTHALETVEQCGILKSNPKLEFRDGVYLYSITRVGNRSLYTVTDGKETVAAPIGWALGLGDAGQTYVFERAGKLYESRVSYFKKLGGLDLTMGAQTRRAANLDEATGRAMTPEGAGECFSCHSTDAVSRGKVHMESMIPGLQCVRCHAGGEAHATAVQRGIAGGSKMQKLSKLSTEEMSNFCGQCHRKWSDIAANGPYGIGNVRFQPYRLANSRCYDATDPRISCVACHNPHQPVTTIASAYDSKCQSCHLAPAKTCPVARKDCTSCHMPKFELPGAHYRFTDHQIRIVRTGERYPN
ncbi:MAG: hypothetical protein M3Z09_01935 [Acidobacteriota bacterium]|nr:hypothetical protein [Acidobacteriota bacterium]